MEYALGMVLQRVSSSLISSGSPSLKLSVGSTLPLLLDSVHQSVVCSFKSFYPQVNKEGCGSF
eukprot:scaffold97455_cov78-Attheya_sp.AAC.3